MSKTQIAVIEFGTSKIVTIVAQNRGIDRLEFVGTGTVPYDGYMNGYWNTPAQMRQRTRDSIAAAELEAKDKIRELYVGVPGEYINIVSAEAEIELNEDGVTDESLELVQDAAAETLHIAEMGGMVLHRSPAWFQVDDGKLTMDPNGHGAVLRARTSFVLADPQFIQDVAKILGDLDITIKGFLSPTLGESLLLLSVDDRDRVSVLIDCGYLNTEISVIQGEAIIYHAMLDIGGGHITAELATQLHIPMRAAEQIKRAYVFFPDEFDQSDNMEVYDARGRKLSFSREMVSKPVERVMDELCDKIARTMQGDVDQLLGPRSQIYLTGGGIALMKRARDYLANKLGTPVKPASPRTVDMNSPVYSAALGLMDLTFDSIEREEEQRDGFGDKLFGGFRKKGKKQQDEEQ